MRGGNINQISMRTIYPDYQGGADSLGVQGSAESMPEPMNEVVTPAGEPVGVTTGGRPLLWWLVLIGLFLGLGFLAQRYGSEGATFGHIRISFYNVMIITLAVIVGLNFAKIIVTALPVPRALRTVVLSA